MTVFKTAPGARVIITSTTNTPPDIYMSDYMRLDGLWIGGAKQTSDLTGIYTGGGSNPISHWKQLVNCTIFGYYGAVKSGSSEYLLIQNNRFVHNGGGTLFHSVYISAAASMPPVPGTFTQHVIVDNNIDIAGVGDGGYAYHFFHNNATGIVTRNFATYQVGFVFDKNDVLMANNFCWRCGTMPNGNILGINLGYTTNGIAENNILGAGPPDDYFLNPNTPSNVVRNNAFYGEPTGLNQIMLTPGQETAQLGISATSLDSAIASLNSSFSKSVDTIFADATIEPNFGTIRGITVPTTSPLYQKGVPWYDGNPINIGPNSGAPSTVAAFWAAFRALGLKEYDSNGNIIP